MRAAFVLALLLSIAAPPGLWHASADASPKGAATAAMGSPAGALCQLVRDTAKAEKTFSSGWFAALASASALPVVVDAEHPIAPAPSWSAVAIDSPPLAPRPPPLV